MKNILILTAPIISHIVPTFNFSHLMANRGYNIYYLVETKESYELVKNNTFSAIIIKTKRVAIGGDLAYYAHKHKKIKTSWIDLIKSHFNLELYDDRRNEFSEILQITNPEMVMIDIFSSTDFMIFYSLNKNLRMNFVNPMLDTKSLSKYPIVYDKSLYLNIKKKIISINFLEYVIWRLTHIERKLIFFKAGLSKKYGFDKKNSRVLLFNNIPELILAPEELENIDHIKRSNQYYLGLNVDLNRNLFFNKKLLDCLELIKKKKKDNYKIVYCSLGTYYSINEYPRITAFLLALNYAVEHTNFCVIVTISNELLEIAKDYLLPTENIYYFSNLPQIDVLPVVDLFITHGGLGSIKEGIFFEKPMLVFPLDTSWDQYSNGVRILEHQLGLLGNLDEDESDTIITNLHNLSSNTIYKKNIINLRKKISDTYTECYFDNLINKLFE